MNQQNRLNIILASVVSILFVAVLFFLSGRAPKTNSITPTVTPVSTLVSTPTPIIITDSTGGWNTYQNPKYHYSFQFPPQFEVSEDNHQDSVSISSRQEILLSFYFSSGNLELTSIGITTANPVEMPTLKIGSGVYPVTKEFFAEGINSGFKNCMESFSATTYRVNIDNKILVSLYKYKGQGCNENGTLKPAKVTSNQEIDRANQILSTFKFTNMESQTSFKKQSGYIKDIVKSNNFWSIDFDPVEILSAKECAVRGIPAPNLNCLVDSKQPTSYPVSPTVSVEVFSLHHQQNGDFQWGEKLLFSDFVNLVLNNSTPEWKNSLYSIEFEDNKVFKIFEQFQP